MVCNANAVVGHWDEKVVQGRKDHGQAHCTTHTCMFSYMLMHVESNFVWYSPPLQRCRLEPGQLLGAQPSPSFPRMEGFSSHGHQPGNFWGL